MKLYKSLINNTCSLWIGSDKVFATLASFDRNVIGSQSHVIDMNKPSYRHDIGFHYNFRSFSYANEVSSPKEEKR